MIDALQTSMIRIGSDARDKMALLREIAALAATSEALSSIPEETLFMALADREALASTGMEKGIAIPHCTFPGVDAFTVGLIVIPDGIDFDAMDGKKSNLVFFIIGPEEKRNRHIKILSSISKLSKDHQLLDALLGADSPETVIKVLKMDETPMGSPVSAPLCRVMIYVQVEELFHDVLEILSSEVEGSVSVTDADRASSYLYRMPLFSSFWDDSSKAFTKIICAVVEKRFLNDVVRRINMVRPEDGSGILITASDLLYADGKIDF